MLFLAENSTLYGAIGVAGVAIVILYSLALGITALWICSETDGFDGLTGVFGAWIFGSAAILFITTTIQRIL